MKTVPWHFNLLWQNLEDFTKREFSPKTPFFFWSSKQERVIAMGRDWQLSMWYDYELNGTEGEELARELESNPELQEAFHICHQSQLQIQDFFHSLSLSDGFAQKVLQAISKSEHVYP